MIVESWVVAFQTRFRGQVGQDPLNEVLAFEQALGVGREGGGGGVGCGEFWACPQAMLPMLIAKAN